MWKKVLYFGIAIVFGILVYIIGYSSNQMNHLEGLIGKAIEKEEFYKVPMVWGGCFDTKSIIDNTTDKMDIMLYPATSQTDVTYGSEDDSKRYLEFERAYYLYIFNAKFSINTATDGTSSLNKTAIEFSSSDEGSTSYDYYFIVNETINSSQYVKEPTTVEEVLLNNSREVTNTNATWNFMRVTFTETMLKQISKEIKGNITKLAVKNSDGEVVFSANVELDFSQGFFKHESITTLLKQYNEYLKDYLAADGDSSKLKEINSKWDNEFTTWQKEFDDNASTTGFAMGYDRSVVTPSKLVWQTIGLLALYAIVILLFYVLLFHFSAIKRLFSRENSKTHSSSSKVLVNGKMVDRKNRKGSREVSSKPTTVITPDVVADEALETVTADEVVSAPEEVKEEPVVEAVEENHSEESMEEMPTPDTIEETPVVEEIKENKEEKVVPATEEAPVEEKPATAKKAPTKKTSTTTKKTTTSKKPTTKKTTAVKPEDKKDETN
ncbi:MAG: hypothetical protein K2O22_05095 [Anaeroplasmataceae bacterium]|nr:hypothetical protein [Anaeroplasmataceae bacterium]